jgi:hypothetical protein
VWNIYLNTLCETVTLVSESMTCLVLDKKGRSAFNT